MSRKLILGSVSPERLVGLTPIGTVNGRSVFPPRGAEGDGHDGPDDDSNDDEPDDDSDDEPDADDKDDDAGKKKATRRPSRGQHPADMRKELRELKKFKREHEAAERNKALADKPEIKRLTVERDDAVKERDSLREKFTSANTQLAIISASHGMYDWADIDDVLNDRTLRTAIEIDDDGEVSGVKEALKDLAKRKPHFLRKAENDDDKSKSNGRAKGTSNGKSGGQPNGGANGDRTADRQRLNSTYPALARLPE